jgi:toxin YoeB
VKLIFSEVSWNDYLHWTRTDCGMAERVNRLIEDIRRSLFTGLGKPESLRHELSGWWSRRLTGEHRLVYRITGQRGEDQRIEIAQCRHHY